jgi:DNA-directed RNA polymerase alpha subunit
MKQDTSDLPKLAAPARRALTSAGITNLKDLTKVSEDELIQLHGMGKNALGTLRDALKAKRLSFRESKKSSAGKMDKTIRTHLDNIRSTDGQLQNQAQFSPYVVKIP